MTDKLEPKDNGNQIGSPPETDVKKGREVSQPPPSVSQPIQPKPNTKK